MYGGTIVTVDYTMHSMAAKDGIRLNETTLYSTVKKAKRFSDIFKAWDDAENVYRKILKEAPELLI